jgi:hypothetical protein
MLGLLFHNKKSKKVKKKLAVNIIKKKKLENLKKFVKKNRHFESLEEIIVIQKLYF